MKTSMAILMSVALSACASLHEEQLAASESILPVSVCSNGRKATIHEEAGQTLVCALEEPVGSHLPDCVCHSAEQAAVEREATQGGAVAAHTAANAAPVREDR